MQSIWVLTFLALFVSLLRGTKLFISKKKMNKKKNLPPSPPNSLPIIGHLHLLKKPLHQSLASLSACYGPIIFLRCGIHRVLVVSSAPLAEQCFTTNDLAFANRPKFPSSRMNSYNYTTIGTASYGAQWREMRRIANVHIFSGHRLNLYSGVRANEVRALARRLYSDSAAGSDFTRVDLRPLLFGLAMNVIMEMIADKRYYGGERWDLESMQFKKVVEETFATSGASNVGDFLPSVIGWFARRRVWNRLTRVHNFRDGFLQALIEERRKNIHEEETGKSTDEKEINQTLIDALLYLQRTHAEQYDDHFIKALVTTIITAGTETSSSAIEWAMSLLLNNPEKLEKAREEIDEIVGCGRLMVESDIPNLSYLHCIVSETLRLYPPGPLLVPHVSQEECRVGGYDIPSGTLLLVNAYVIQRDGETWVEPNEFRPERFMSESNRGEVGMMLPFGMGRRKCPGEGLALREVGLVLGTLVQCFEWMRIGSEELDMQEGSGLTMPKLQPLQSLCRPRHCMISALAQL